MYQSGNRNSVKHAEERLSDAEKNLRRAKLRRELEMKPRKKRKRIGIIITLVVSVVSAIAGTLIHPGLLFTGLFVLAAVWFSVWLGQEFGDEVRPTAKEILDFEFRVEDAKEELAEAYMEAN